MLHTASATVVILGQIHGSCRPSISIVEFSLFSKLTVFCIPLTDGVGLTEIFKKF